MNNPWITQAIACELDHVAHAGAGYVLPLVVLSIDQERCYEPSESRPAATAISRQVPMNYAFFRLQEKSLSFATEAWT